jgi:hypothetical protein
VAKFGEEPTQGSQGAAPAGTTGAGPGRAGHDGLAAECRCDLCKAANAGKSAALAAKKQQRMAGPTLPLLLTLWTVVLASSEARTRTENRPVNSRMLCQLSYLGLVFGGFSVTAGHLEPYVTAQTCNFSTQRRPNRKTARLTASCSAS